MATVTDATAQHIQLMLRVYEKERGPALGLDFAREARVFEREHRFLPPADDEERAILKDCFRAHLQANRFSGSIGEWFAARQDKTHIGELVSVISPDMAVARAYEVMLTSLGTVVDAATEFNRTVAAPIYTILRSLNVSRSRAEVSFAEEAVRASAAIRGLNVSTHLERFWGSNKSLVNGIDKTRYLAERQDVSFGEQKEISRFRHTLGQIPHPSFAVAEFIDLLVGCVAREGLTGALADDLIEAVSSWHSYYEVFAQSYFTHRFLEWKRKMDAQVMDPLKEIVDQLLRGNEHNDAVEKIRVWARDGNVAERIEGLSGELRPLTEHLSVWSRALWEQYPQSDDQRRRFSAIHHNIGSLVQKGMSAIYEASDRISGVLSGAVLQEELVKNLRDVFEGWHSVEALSRELPPLEYAKALGARVAQHADLPPDVDERYMRLIFMYLIGNARDFPRTESEYKGGEKFEVVVTIDPDKVSVSDNGRGMTEARLALVREAMRTRNPIESDHGGTGRGLIDVASIVPKLFTGDNMPPPTYELQSTLGVGTTFTIHFPQMPVRVR